MTPSQSKKYPSNKIKCCEYSKVEELLLGEMLREDFLEVVAFEQASGEDSSISDKRLTPAGDEDSHANPGYQEIHTLP